MKVYDQSFPTAFDKITGGRPHNGVLLEASPLPFPPVTALLNTHDNATEVHLQVDLQSAEDATINVNASTIPVPSRSSPSSDNWRHPLIVMVDGILDPGNLGNIIRSCHFYSVDAVAICINTCAPMTSPVVIKASSGAAEAVRLLAINKPADFVRSSVANGWTAYAAVAPDDGAPGKFVLGGKRTKKELLMTSSMQSPLAKKPCVLMIGSEGEGLRSNLRDKALGEISIGGVKSVAKMDVGVDSLNVSAATAVLLEAFMHRPDTRRVNGNETPDSLAEKRVF